jgi:hypothetical protein
MEKYVFCLVGLGVSALALSGCIPISDSASIETDPESFFTFSDGLLTYEQKVNADGSYFSNAARLAGTLSFENGCLLVGGEPHAFPADGTSWDGATLIVKGKEFVLGDELVGGGGGAPDGTELPDEALDRCGDDSLVFIVSGVDPKN